MSYTLEEEWVDGREAAKMLGLKNHRTLTIWRERKSYPELIYRKIGHSVLYKLTSVEQFAATYNKGKGEKVDNYQD